MRKALANFKIISTFPNFCNNWQRVSAHNSVEGDLKTRLAVFIDEWKQIGWRSDVPVQVKEVDAVRLDTFLQDAEPALIAINDARRSGEMANVWGVSGLKREEARVSAVLAWFLNRHGEHGQGDALLSGLIKRINLLYPDKTKCPLSEHVSGKPYWVNVESCPLGERKNRVDIEIEGDSFLLFIEVKIDAPETNDQIQRYLETGDNKSNNRNWCVVFLNPSGEKPKKSPDHPQLITIAWKEVEYVFRNYAKDLDKCYAKEMIHQFAKYISAF